MSNANKASHSEAKNGNWDVLDEAKEQISELADDASARGEKIIGQVKDRGSELWHDAQHQRDDAWKGIQSLIQKHPGKAVGYAFVAGAAFYALYGRRQD